jgi:hypothetical protein
MNVKNNYTLYIKELAPNLTQTRYLFKINLPAWKKKL